ncbi:hypothetical protein C0995_008044 [Termitomyces sp. Mi166|nr:hypothetical protein C0995_008044 [Termitomyces sp. Mi166\
MQEAEEQALRRKRVSPSFILANARERFGISIKIGKYRYWSSKDLFVTLRASNSLTTWLSHSKKKNCDVCKHPYSFTKVYASNMPTSLPTLLLVKKLIQQILFALLFGLRGIVVGIIWLTALPWATVWTWRMYFSMGESTAWWISGRTRPPSSNNDGTPFYYHIHFDKSLPQPTTFLGRLTTHPVWTALSADIFTGQIIASLIVLTFVAVFLLREWISQNARPGIFDDDEFLPEEGVAPRPDPRPPAGPPPQPHPLEEALARRQAEALRALEALREGADGPNAAEERRQDKARLINRKGKGRWGRKDRFDSDRRAVTRRKLLPADDEDEGDEMDYEKERVRRKAFTRRVHYARLAGARRKVAWRAMGQEPLARLPLQVDPTFQFTFVPPPATAGPQVPPPRIPFTFDGVKWVPSSETQGAAGDAGSSSFSSLNQRRPTLPSSSTPDLSSSASPFSPSAVSQAVSQRLASYRAPEELEEAEAGPSRLPESYQADEDDEDEGIDKDEFAHYFNDPEAEERTSRPGTPSDDDTDREGDGDDEGSKQDVNEHVDDVFEHEGDDDEPMEMEDFVLDAWEAADGEGAGEGAVPEAGGAGPAENGALALPLPREQRAAQNPGIQIEFAPELAEELEGNVEDDMEGAMEAIGMRGPIYGVLQNAALMIFVLDTAIGLGIWIPFTIGKTTALLSLDPPRFLQILHLPIRAIRLVTDPFVDSVAFFILEILLPSFIRAAIRTIKFFGIGILWLIGPLLGQGVVDNIVAGSAKLAENVEKFGDNPLEGIISWTAVSTSMPQETTEAPSFVLEYFDKFINVIEPYFAPLGEKIRLISGKALLMWEQMAVGEGPANRAFAIYLGYAVVGLLLSVYLNFIAAGNAKTAGRAVRIAVRQQLLVLKVATFIFIELISFPLSCGIVLDLCTVWYFPEANFTSRLTFFTQAPLTAVFYHWVAGTMFMYAFAVALSGCRSVMRPGAMWFIKDPQDVNSHPIREILDRSTLEQLRKILISGVMYSCVVACVVGSMAGLLKLGRKSIMPIRWKNREPLSNVPVDLLFLHIVLPYTMHYFRPKKALKALTTIVWKFVAKRLRLTSYFFTGRYIGEERSMRWPFIKAQDGDRYIADGTFRRVPATDNVILPRDMRVTAAVTADGQPVDDVARELMTLQNMEVQRAGRQIKDEFVVVYIPPYFRYRIFCFITVMWVIGAFALGFVVGLPVLLGRRFFELFTTKSVHDGYSLIVGFYMMWGFYLLGSSIDRLDRRRQRTSGERHRGQDLPIVVLKRGAVFVVKSLYMALCLGVLIPTLISFVIDLYIVLPIRFTLDPGMTPRIRVVDTWALGLIYVKIALHANRLQPPNRFSRGIQHIIHNGWSKSDPVQATREVIGPLAGGLFGMILFPGLVFRVIRYLFPNIPLDDKFIFMHIYPGIFLFVGLVRSAFVLYGLLGTWSQSVRDKEFLVEMRLRNHEPEKVSKYKESGVGTDRVGGAEGEGEFEGVNGAADGEGAWEEVAD